MTFHEESSFRRYRELLDIEEEDVEVPTVENSNPESSSPDISREDGLDEVNEVLEPINILEISLDDPPIKRRHA